MTEEAYSTTVGYRVKKLRTKLRLTQKDLALRIGGKDPTIISRIESNRNGQLRYDSALELAKALYTTPEYILTGSGTLERLSKDAREFISNPANIEIVERFVREQRLKKSNR